MNYANTMALNTLNVLAPFLNSIRQNWCIIGQAGLMLQGLDTKAEVVDVVTDEEGAGKLARLLAAYPELESGKEDAGDFDFSSDTISSNVSRYTIGGTTVRVLSNVKVKVSDSWVKLLELIGKKETFDYNGYRLILPSLADQLKISKLIGKRTDLEAAERISSYMAS